MHCGQPVLQLRSVQGGAVQVGWRSCRVLGADIGTLAQGTSGLCWGCWGRLALPRALCTPISCCSLFKVRQRCHRVAWRSKFAVPDPGGLIWPDVMCSAHLCGAQRAGGEEMLFSLLLLLLLPAGGGRAVSGC